VNKKIIPISIGIIAVVTLALASTNYEPPHNSVNGVDFGYSDYQTIKNNLDKKNIHMSSPTMISDSTVKQYCMYYDQDNVQQIPSRCLTTALLDSDGNPLGNVNIGGTHEHALMALAVLESKPLLDSEKDAIGIVFETMIETLVCDCWEQTQPGKFNSIKEWIDASESHYLNSGKTTLNSKISGLAGKELILEITKTDNSYLWTLIIVK